VASRGKFRNETTGHAGGGPSRLWAGGYPPCFCVSRGNKGVTGEWLASRGNKGVIGRKSEGGAKGMRAFAKTALGKGVGRSEMAQEQRPLSITGEA